MKHIDMVILVRVGGERTAKVWKIVRGGASGMVRTAVEVCHMEEGGWDWCMRGCGSLMDGDGQGRLR